LHEKFAWLLYNFLYNSPFRPDSLKSNNTHMKSYNKHTVNYSLSKAIFYRDPLVQLLIVSFNSHRGERESSLRGSPAWEAYLKNKLHFAAIVCDGLSEQYMIGVSLNNSCYDQMWSFTFESSIDFYLSMFGRLVFLNTIY